MWNAQVLKMIQTFPLLVAAAAVGILHMSAPDHWATLALLGKSQKWKHSKLIKISAITGVGHVALSILLGFAIVSLGLLFPKSLFAYVTYAIGLIMLIAGSWYAIKALGTKNTFDYKKHGEEHFKKGISYFAVLGAALSPDLSILPIFLIAIPMGFNFAVYTAIVFGISSLATLLILVGFGHLIVEHSRFSKRIESIHPKYNDALVGAVIAMVGVYILVFG